MPQRIQVAEPGRHVQPSVHALLGVCLGRRQLGTPDGELHTRLFVGDLVFEVRLSAVFPLLKHVRQLVQATMVEVEHFVLAFPTGDDQLATGAGLIAEEEAEGAHLAQIHSEHTTDLLQGASPLRLIPALGL